MKLAEFLNDDTCQIFLAIIIGIVVCYFIFGSCGTGGCSRRDGFSVGGQHCNTANTPAECCDNTYDTSCLVLGTAYGNDAKCDRADKSSETYCFNESSKSIIPDPLITRTISSMPREEGQGPLTFDVGCEILGGTIYRKSNSQNVYVCPETPAPPPPPGNSSPPTGNSSPPTGNSLPSNSKYLNILSNMASAVLEIAESALAVSSTDDSRFLNEMMTNPDPTKSNFERVKSIAETNGIYFQILINGSQGRNFDLLNKFVRFIYPDKSYRRAQVFGNLFKTFSEAPTQVKKDLYCGQNSMFVKYSDNEFEKYDPLLKMKSANIMTHEYVNCDGDNTIFPTSSCPTDDISLLNNCDFHIRDPNNNLPPPSNFQSIAWEVDSVSSEFKRIMNNHSESDKYIEFVKNSYIQAADRRSAMQTVLRNPYEILIIDATSSYSIISGVNRLYMYVNSDIYIDVGLEDAKSRLYFVNDNAIDSSIDNFDSSQEQSSILEFEMKPSTISKLHKVYGMSQTGDGNIYKSNKGGEDPSLSDNKYNYFMNLLFIQYLITRIYLGTDNYLPFNLNIYDKQPANPLESDPDNREDIPSITGQNEEYTTNSLCARSGTDYLLLVYTEEDDKQDDEQVPAPLPAPLPACNNGGSRTLSIGDGSTRNTWSSSLPQECIYANSTKDGRSERCANNCEGCYQVVNGVGHVCKDYSGKHDTRVCTVDYECQP